ncbi:TraR/DksA family transcriptional regulator [Streptomyces sp. NPDC058045]|uniref:TraR/DksA family transcriptional regulator n=1 Tax=Streptomyces sp. NPDC058045 TaxID=3346311 RepID=UPI0036E2190F
MVAKKTAVQHSEKGGTAASRGRSTAADGAGRAPGKSRPTPEKAAGKRTATKKTAKKTATKKTATAAKKAAPKQAAAAEKTAAEKRSAKKTAAKKTAAKKAAPKKAAAKKTAAGKSAAQKAGAEVAAVKKSAKKSAGRKKAEAPRAEAGRKGAGHETAAPVAEGAAEAAETTGATPVVAKKTVAKNPTPVPLAAEPGELAVRPGEDPWTKDEVDEARAELTAEVLRLNNELESSEQSLAGLMRDSGDGAGDDEADTGSKNITREHELALAANAREMLQQSERALERLDAGTYGVCENCGNPIGKARMQAFPRATLCVECKQKQERRY